MVPYCLNYQDPPFTNLPKTMRPTPNAVMITSSQNNAGSSRHTKCLKGQSSYAVHGLVSEQKR